MRAERITVDGKTDRDALMTDAAPAIFVAIEGSAFAAAIRQSPYAYMAANVAHILSLMVFFGAVAVMDLRLAGDSSRRHGLAPRCDMRASLRRLALPAC